MKILSTVALLLSLFAANVAMATTPCVFASGIGRNANSNPAPDSTNNSSGTRR